MSCASLSKKPVFAPKIEVKIYVKKLFLMSVENTPFPLIRISSGSYKKNQTYLNGASKACLNASRLQAMAYSEAEL